MKDCTLLDLEKLPQKLAVVTVDSNMYLFTLLRIVFPSESSFSGFWEILAPNVWSTCSRHLLQEPQTSRPPHLSLLEPD